MSSNSSGPTKLSAETVRDYILSKGGRVYNTDLVKYFRPLLVHPQTKDVAREDFKKIINKIAVVLRDERDEKYLILKRHSNEQSPMTSPEPSLSYSSSFTSLLAAGPHSPSMDSLSSIPGTSKHHPPPYRSPPPVLSPTMQHPPGMCISRTSSDSSVEKTPPPVPPRRRSSEKLKLSNKENEQEDVHRGANLTSDDSESKVADEQKISVKERTQRFNRMASTEEPIIKQQIVGTSAACKKRFDKGALSDRDEEDCVSVTSFDPRSREWLVRAAQGDYQALAKMCAENPKLARLKDPTTYTALHWGAKHGNMDIVKLIAGTCKVDPNVRTNGGYTPLHIAAQFNREDVYDLLVKVYGADPNLRDWSGKKPYQYKGSGQGHRSLKSASIRKTKSLKKHSEKDSGFLRIGSLNVRVKRTTEAVSNFLGVSQSNLDKAHKTWGSADSIQDCKKMPPPNSIPPKKRKPKQPKEGTNSLVISESKSEEKSDSDSDSAVGFGQRWKQTV